VTCADIELLARRSIPPGPWSAEQPGGTEIPHSLQTVQLIWIKDYGRVSTQSLLYRAPLTFFAQKPGCYYRRCGDATLIGKEQRGGRPCPSRHTVRAENLSHSLQSTWVTVESPILCYCGYRAWRPHAGVHVWLERLRHLSAREDAICCPHHCDNQNLDF